MNIQDVLNAVAAGGSDYAASKKLGINRQMFSIYRTGRKTPSDEMLDKIVEMTDLSLQQVYLAVYAEKLKNPMAAEAFRTLAAH